MSDLNHCYTVDVQLTAQQHDKILELCWLMDLDPDQHFAELARRVILDSLDRRLESALHASGGKRY